MRVFNLLRPPSHFPVIRGDEHGILTYYSGGEGGALKASRGSGDDPYATAAMRGQFDDHTDDGLSRARRVELLRAIHEQRGELQDKDEIVENLRRRLERLQAESGGHADTEDHQALREEVNNMQQRLAAQTDELETAGEKACVLQGQNRVLREEFRVEKDQRAELLVELSAARLRLEAELTRRGEDESWHLISDQQRQTADAVRRRLEHQLLQTDAGRVSAEAISMNLREEANLLRSEMEHQAAGAAAANELEVDRLRANGAAQRLESERRYAELELIHKQVLSDAEALRTEVLEEIRQREVAVREAEALRAEVKAIPQLEATIEKLRGELRSQSDSWRKMFKEYNLIGQAFFGSGQGSGSTAGGSTAC